jgi:hypothetical protein
MLVARCARSIATAARAALPRVGAARAGMAADAAVFTPDALETEVGISVFANQAKGFTAVLKHRCALASAALYSAAMRSCDAPRAA